MPKLTEGHVRPQKLKKKIKVSCCTETESETMYKFIRQAVQMKGIII